MFNSVSKICFSLELTHKSLKEHIILRIINFKTVCKQIKTQTSLSRLAAVFKYLKCFSDNFSFVTPVLGQQVALAGNHQVVLLYTSAKLFFCVEQMFSLGKKCKTHYASLEGMTGMKELFALCCGNILKFSDKVAFIQPCFDIIQTAVQQRCTEPLSNSASTFGVCACMEVNMQTIIFPGCP